MEAEQRPVLLGFAFAETAETPDRLILDVGGVGSYMHKLLAEIVAQVFEDVDVEPD